MPKDDRRIYDKPGHLIRRLQQISLLSSWTRPGSLRSRRCSIQRFSAIEYHPGIDQTALCNIIAYDRSTIGDVVTRLKRKKLIKRTPGAEDRRSKLLYITPAGRKLIDDIEPAVEATQRRIVEPLTANERTALMQMLKKLVHLNNENSRAPQRIDDRAQRRPALPQSRHSGRMSRRRNPPRSAG